MFEIFTKLLQGVIDANQANPQVAAIGTIVMICRALFKPLCALIIAGVAASPSTRDDQMLSDLRANPLFIKFAFLLDLIFSIKFPALKPVEAPPVA